MDSSIGSRLRDAREERGLSIAHVCEAVRLRPSVIQWLESDDFTPCGPPAYVRGYLRSLASYLDLPADDIVADYIRQYQPAPPAALPRHAERPARRGPGRAAGSVAEGSDGDSAAAAGKRAAAGSNGSHPRQRPARRGTPRVSSSAGAGPGQDPSVDGPGADPTDAGAHVLGDSRRWLPLIWFLVVMTVVAALGYTLVAHDARSRSTIPATTGIRTQPFSPSPAPFTVGTAGLIHAPQVLRA